MRRAGRTDANQRALVGELRKRGYVVAVTSSTHKGFPDLVVGRESVCRLVEVKDPAKPPSARGLTPDQLDFAERWGPIYVVALTVEDVERAFEEDWV